MCLLQERDGTEKAASGKEQVADGKVPGNRRARIERVVARDAGTIEGTGRSAVATTQTAGRRTTRPLDGMATGRIAKISWGGGWRDK